MALQKKPPVVTIMGHVDHGKTSLLDFIRKTKVAAFEHGEITQAIGAYQIEIQNQKITFIDTPGHEAFMKMRQRGAAAADIVVLVVAATDGVMPQTKESIKIIKEVNVPFLLAINKIDLPEASIDKVKTQLAEAEVFIEGYGGDIVAVPISAKTGQGIDQLLEMILLTAEMADLKADIEAGLEAVVIESKFDKLIGAAATMIVKNGRIKKGDVVWIGGKSSKLRMLKNSQGKMISEALPGDPVLATGFDQLPPVGSVVSSKMIGEKKSEETGETDKTVKLEEKPKFKIILKADVDGSLEAVFNSLSKNVEVLEKSVGEINQSDVLLAKTLNAEIFGFNIKSFPNIEKLAQSEKVKIRTYDIIYDLLQDIEKKATKFLKPENDRKILGRAEICKVFDMKGQKIAGCKTVEGKINKNSSVMIKRGENTLFNTRIVSFKEQKQDINEASAGTEFGAVFGGKLDFQPGDMVISYGLEEN